MHDLRENFFLNGKRRRGKSGEQGTENAGTKEEEEGKATGKRGNSTGKVGATRLKTRIRGNGKPKDGDRKNSKDDKEEEVPG
ncbi:hypothetical protein PC1C4_22900 [Paraprevotella clara]|jgi:hypothetical protein|uniref:hypothetical protein n=1 Tax=Paraprevotella clara TaxID=454154 RepID=UPI00248F5F56|nr:hypothetical protein [Paraprevotella clara]BDI73482.1 hypothetical protein PC1C4_02040 [Paraprevotella clara]BDI73841.1 hypothetical protein PC1C4_05630 [Paraprevotella clara]BDI74540.1 hypothetical protein PC1C4_12620 [Paraprevotella clara]BDI75568.1 hypothetical protein PC1C4_22900 [Paraprevotella clara]